MADLEANRDRDQKLLQQEDHTPTWCLDFAAVSVWLCVFVLALLLLYPVLIHRQPTPADVDLHSFSQSPLSGSGAGVRPYNISWDISFHFSSPTSVYYVDLLASLDWIRIPCADPILLAEATVPNLRLERGTATLIGSTLHPVVRPQDNACDDDALLHGRVWHMRLQLRGSDDPRSVGAGESPLMLCKEITMDAANSRVFGHPTDCSTDL